MDKHQQQPVKVRSRKCSIRTSVSFHICAILLVVWCKFWLSVEKANSLIATMEEKQTGIRGWHSQYAASLIPHHCGFTVIYLILELTKGAFSNIKKKIVFY